jgi:hypothetical protein
VLLNNFPTMAKGGRTGFHGALATNLKEALWRKQSATYIGAEHINLIFIMYVSL